jgi:hypothetical protein
VESSGNRANQITGGDRVYFNRTAKMKFFAISVKNPFAA